jgi:L-alanine-DL-glutamate epimerase-like enolase superfamily enzyme
MEQIKLSRIEAQVYRVPLDIPVKTSFGSMYDRPAVLVRVEDSDGIVGWGEVWCNWPACGAEHRALLVTNDLADLCLGQPFDTPGALYTYLTDRTAVKVLQTGEMGPFSHAIAGLDIAVWDLFGKRAEQPIAKLLSRDAASSIRAYASGIHINDAAEVIPASRVAGFRHFKVKVGFDRDRDISLIREVAGALQPGEGLFADANQGWTPDAARHFLAATRSLSLGWMEEPLRVDTPAHVWQALALDMEVPLAGGENLIGMGHFQQAIEEGALAVIQPDVAKWGGISGCIEVARLALSHGRRYCPHYLGAGIGLVASAHLLAAAGGDGLLEIDVNPNPLRGAIRPTWPEMHDGWTEIPVAPGLGVAPDLDSLETYLSSRHSAG